MVTGAVTGAVTSAVTGAVTGVVTGAVTQSSGRWGAGGVGLDTAAPNQTGLLLGGEGGKREGAGAATYFANTTQKRNSKANLTPRTQLPTK